MADLTTSVKLNVNATYSYPRDFSTTVDALTKTITLTLADGTGTNNADMIFHDSRQLATGANESLDLAGVLTDAFGTTLTFAKIKFLAIKNNTTGQTLTVGNATNAFEGWISAAGTITVQANSWAVLIADPVGYTVTAATDDELKIVNSAGVTVTYEIIIVGASA